MDLSKVAENLAKGKLARVDRRDSGAAAGGARGGDMEVRGRGAAAQPTMTRAEIEAKLAAKPDWLVEKVRGHLGNAVAGVMARSPQALTSSWRSPPWHARRPAGAQAPAGPHHQAGAGGGAEAPGGGAPQGRGRRCRTYAALEARDDGAGAPHGERFAAARLCHRR